MKKIIQRITKHRKEKGLTYENVALELEISTAAYRKIETGETKLTLERLFKLSTILDASIIDLLDLHEDSFHTNSNNIMSLDSQDLFLQLLKSKEDQILLLKEIISKKLNNKTTLKIES